MLLKIYSRDYLTEKRVGSFTDNNSEFISVISELQFLSANTVEFLRND